MGTRMPLHINPNLARLGDPIEMDPFDQVAQQRFAVFHGGGAQTPDSAAATSRVASGPLPIGLRVHRRRAGSWDRPSHTGAALLVRHTPLVGVAVPTAPAP